MTDNVTLPGTGAVVKTDVVGDGHVQFNKILSGDDGGSQPLIIGEDGGILRQRRFIRITEVLTLGETSYADAESVGGFFNVDSVPTGIYFLHSVFIAHQGLADISGLTFHFGMYGVDAGTVVSHESDGDGYVPDVTGASGVLAFVHADDLSYRVYPGANHALVASPANNESINLVVANTLSDVGPDIDCDLHISAVADGAIATDLTSGGGQLLVSLGLEFVSTEYSVWFGGVGS